MKALLAAIVATQIGIVGAVYGVTSHTMTTSTWGAALGGLLVGIAATGSILVWRELHWMDSARAAQGNCDKRVTNVRREAGDRITTLEQRSDALRQQIREYQAKQVEQAKKQPDKPRQESPYKVDLTPLHRLPREQQAARYLIDKRYI